MGEDPRVSRRRFIQVTSVSVMSANLWTGCVRFQPARSLTADQLALVESVADQIIPPDQDPGAAWAGVVEFIDRALMGHYKDLQKTYKSKYMHRPAGQEAR